jgi:hypothetical protein
MEQQPHDDHAIHGSEPLRRSGPAAEHYAMLRRASRARRWALLLELGFMIGLFAGLVLEWWQAILAAVTGVAVAAMWDSNRGVIAGWWPGDPGRQRLAAAAARLERRGCGTLPTPVRPDDGPLAAYLIIGPGGVFVVDHQAWETDVAVGAEPTDRWTLYNCMPDVRRRARLKEASASVARVLPRTSDRRLPVFPIVTMDGPFFRPFCGRGGVMLLHVADLVEFVEDTPATLTPAEVRALTDEMHRAFAALPR